MAKVITFNTNSNNQFTIITIFKTKFLSNITTTRSIVSSFIYFPNSTTTSTTSPRSLRTSNTRAGIPCPKQHWINSIPINTPISEFPVLCLSLLLNVTVPFISSFLRLRYCISFWNIIVTYETTRFLRYVSESNFPSFFIWQ